VRVLVRFFFPLYFLFSKQSTCIATLFGLGQLSQLFCLLRAGEHRENARVDPRPQQRNPNSPQGSHNANVQQRNPDDFLPLIASSPQTNRLDARFAEIQNSSQNDNVNSESANPNPIKESVGEPARHPEKPKPKPKPKRKKHLLEQTRFQIQNSSVDLMAV
jgi:hypothetical protein